MLFYLISIDCESTGLSVYNDQIVELGAVLYLWDSVTLTWTMLPSFSRYALPTQKIMCGKAAEITGISMASLKDQPPIQQVLGDFYQHLEEHCPDTDIPRLLLSYNGFTYDIPLLVCEIERYGGSAIGYFRTLKIQHAIDLLPFGRTHLDTSLLKRKSTGSCSYKLGDVYLSVCRCPLADAHGALADSRAVLEILQCMDVQRPFQTLVGRFPENEACKNPMTLVRTILERLALLHKKPPKGQSKRVGDMLQRYHQKKTKLNL